MRIQRHGHGLLGVGATALLALVAPHTAHGVEGVLQINQTCAVNSGCFAGDTAGFPVAVTATGSYRLTSNLVVPDENTTAILVSANNVTVDLNGFHVSGPTTCTTGPTVCSPTGGGDGIDAGFTSGITVRNGHITGTGAFGVRLLGSHNRVEGITMRNIGFQGIRVGSHSTVKDCRAFATGHIGISAGAAVVVVGNAVARSGNHGIFANSGVVEDNAVTFSGVDGINTAANGTPAPLLVRSNSSTNNLGRGLYLRPESGYADNVISGNSIGTVLGGVEMGTNLCNGNTTCP